MRDASASLVWRLSAPAVQRLAHRATGLGLQRPPWSFQEPRRRKTRRALGGNIRTSLQAPPASSFSLASVPLRKQSDWRFMSIFGPRLTDYI
jgi:hypothetical protein